MAKARYNRETTQVINEILGFAPFDQIGERFVDEMYPDGNHQPSANMIKNWLSDQGILFTGEQTNAINYAIRMAKAWDMDKPHIVELKKINAPADVARHAMQIIRYEDQEVLLCYALNTKNGIKKHKEIFRGSLNVSIIHPREIFRFAILESAANIIIVHNHPSGDPAPSPKDIHATKQIKQAGEIMDIKLTDHVIIGDGHWISMREEGII